jgi:4-amino-4-deoxy-L-arabinose transferase-like glycosyltransferase
MQRKDWIALLAIFITAFICFLPALNAYGMLDPTDSFFFEVPREMIERSHYVTPLYNYIDWLDKPAFPFWLTIVSYKLFGINDFAARLPAALSGMILVVATYIFSLKKIGRRAAILSAVILSSSPLFLIVGHVALSDEALSMLFGLSMLFIGEALACNKQRINLIAYVFLALAVLCKGPIALVLVAGTVCLYLLTVSNSLYIMQENLLKLRPIAAIFILFGLCFPYYYFAHVTTSGAFTDQFFLRQNLGRFQGKVNHLEPAWFYVPVFFAGYFPWCFYLLLSLPWLKKILVWRYKLSQRQKFIVFCLCWFLFVGGLFTLIPTRLPTYIVPFSPALAILTGSFLDVVLKAKATKKYSLSTRKDSIKSIVISLPPLLALIGAFIVFFLLIAKMVRGSVFIALSTGLFMMAIFSLYSLQAFWTKKYNKAIISLCLASIFGCAILVPASFCWFYESRQIVMNRMISIVRQENANLATLFSPVPSIVFYLQRQIPNVESLEELRLFCKEGKKPHFLLASRNCLEMSQLRANEHIVNTDGKWYLLNVEGFPWK